MPRGRGPHKTAFKDFSGRTFNHWIVIEQSSDAMCGRVRWLCKCVCGTEKPVMASHLLTGRSKSCGCQRPIGVNSLKFKHGKSGTILHNIWMAMLHRCQPHSKNRHLYFDKGIQVCERWHTFENFVADMGERPSSRHSLGRIDGFKGYEPGNVRWETPKQQANNTTRNKFITHDGLTLTMRQWAEKLGMNYNKLKYRITHKWPIEKALNP